MAKRLKPDPRPSDSTLDDGESAESAERGFLVVRLHILSFPASTSSDDVVERDLLPTCRGPVRSWIRAGSWRRFRRVPTRSVVTCEFRHTRIIIKIYLMNVRQPLSRPSREIAGWLVGEVVRSPECFARSSSDGCAKETPNEVRKPIRRFSFHLVSN